MDSLPQPPKWRRYLRFWRPDVVGDVDDELTFHLESRADELVALGMTRDSASAQAMAEMGDLAQVRGRLAAVDRRVRRRRSVREQLSALGADVRYAYRRLRGSPMFTIAATFTLAIAIGATASVFGLVDGVLLKAFPYRDPSRVLAISESGRGWQAPQAPVSPANYLDWCAQNRVFTTLAAVDYQEFTVTGAQEPERVAGAVVTPSYFPVLGITPALGRGLASDSGGPAEVVIGHGYWQRRFASSGSVIGQKLMVDDRAYTIVGVMPPGLPGQVELWLRLRFTGAQAAKRDSHYLSVFGRLLPGVSRESAERAMKTIAERLALAYPRTNESWSVEAKPLVDDLVGNVRPALVMLLAAAACVLLIGAANLANLFLVRALARQRELALRTALGAPRSRLVRELLAEAVLLGLSAGALGVGAAVAGVRVLRSLAPSMLPRVGEIGVDGRVVAFCALSLIATVLIFGMLPAWVASRDRLADVLKEGGRGTGSAPTRALQDGLVVLQVAVALLLLTGAGLLVDSFARFERMDPGFRPEGVLTAQLNLPTERYPTAERQTAFVSSVVDRLVVQPGVVAAAAGDALPNTSVNRNDFAIIGDPPPDPTHTPIAYTIGVSPEYFGTMGIRVLRGRGVQPTDGIQAPKVAVVDELLARRYFPGRDAIGQRFVFRDTPTGPDTIEIVGIVGTVKEGGLVAEDYPEIYASLAQYDEPYVALAVRTSGDPEALTRTLRRVVASVDPTVPVSEIKTMKAWMTESIDTTRFSTFLASLFAVVAIILGMVGIYSVLAYIVSQRQREIAVRIALGASRFSVMRDVLKRALALTGTGIVFGSVAAWMLTRALRGILLGVSPHDPVVFVGAAGVFSLVALAAASIPAFRTTRVNPVVALTST
jgi:predicted permease